MKSIGIALSILCAIHCMLLPVLILAASFIGTSFLNNPLFEIALLPVAFVFAAYILRKDYQIHANNRPWVLLAIALPLLIVGLIFHSHLFIGTGATCMAIAQFLNWRLHREHCNHHHH